MKTLSPLILVCFLIQKSVFLIRKRDVLHVSEEIVPFSLLVLVGPPGK